MFLWWSGRRTSSGYHKLQWDIICFRDTGPSNSEAITLKLKGQRVGEAGISLPDQLIGWLETQEQLRKLVALFSEVKRVQCREGEQRLRIGVLFHRSLYQGSFKIVIPTQRTQEGVVDGNTFNTSVYCEIVLYLLHWALLLISRGFFKDTFCNMYDFI